MEGFLDRSCPSISGLRSVLCDYCPPDPLQVKVTGQETGQEGEKLKESELYSLNSLKILNESVTSAMLKFLKGHSTIAAPGAS